MVKKTARMMRQLIRLFQICPDDETSRLLSIDDFAFCVSTVSAESPVRSEKIKSEARAMAPLLFPIISELYMPRDFYAQLQANHESLP